MISEMMTEAKVVKQIPARDLEGGGVSTIASRWRNRTLASAVEGSAKSI